MRHLRIAIALLLVTVILLGGCAQPAPAPEPTKAPVAEPAAMPATSAPEATKAPEAAAEPGSEYPRPPKPTKQYTIGLLLPHLSNPHFIGQAYGYIDEAEQLGVKMILLEAGGYQFLDKQVSQMEDLIASKVDAIILVAINGPGTVAPVEQAVKAGIPVINCNVMTDSDQVVTRIRSDDEVIGQMQADYLGSLLNGTGKVVMSRGAPGTSWAENRGNAFKARIAEKFPGIEVVGEQYCQSTPADGLKLMEDYLQTYPEIDGVYSGADTVGIGAAQAVLAAGKIDDIMITTVDFQKDCEDFIRQGVIKGSVIQQTVIIGRWGVRAAVNYLEGREVPKELFTPLILVDSDNIDSLDLRGVRAPDGWKPPVS